MSVPGYFGEARPDITGDPVRGDLDKAVTAFVDDTRIGKVVVTRAVAQNPDDTLMLTAGNDLLVQY